MLETLRLFEMLCKAYFCLKEVLLTEQIEKVAWGLQDPCLQNWFMVNEMRIKKMTFRDYTEELQKMWLPFYQQERIQAHALSTLQGKRNFLKQAIDIQSKNAILQDMTSYLEEGLLQPVGSE